MGHASGSRQHSGGFTLIELVVVLAFMAMMVTLVVLRQTQPHQRAVLNHAAEQWILLEAQARHQSHRLRQPGTVHFQCPSGEVIRRLPGDIDAPASVLQFPHGVQIDRYLDASHKHPQRRGQIAIPFNSRGQTNTYAVRLCGPGQLHQWLLVLGVTGDVQKGLSEEEVYEAIRLSS